VTAADTSAGGPALAGVPVVFLLFVATLAGVLIFHRRAWAVALAGLALIAIVRVAFSRFDASAHVAAETPKLLNLVGLLVGFGVLAEHFDASHAGAWLARRLPAGRAGAFALVSFVWLLSAVLDNIAAATIGVTLAARAFGGKVHLGYLIAMVAAANAGGAGSVIGDTTTTMIWLDGVSPLRVLPASIGSAAVLLVVAGAGTFQQHRHAPLAARGEAEPPIDGWRLAIVGAALVALVSANVAARSLLGARADHVPLTAAVLWAVIAAGALARRVPWRPVRDAAGGSVLLLALVSAASLMPVDRMPPATWRTTLGLGLVSSVFDNIPLTKLALDQGGYDWALLAYSVGVGGSMIWFGSSAGVAVAARFPEARSTLAWLRAGWHVPVAFFVGFAVQYAIVGWNP